MSGLDQLMAKIESYGEEMIEAQRALTAVPALGPTNGGQGEWDKALVAEKWLRDMGLELERVDAPDERVESGLRPNLVARAPGGNGPATWVLSHLDVVPTGSLELWSSDPWQLRQEGDRLYGRGVMDNQAGMVSSLFGLKAVLELGLPLPGPAGLVLVSDEETGSGHGLDYLLDARPDFFQKQDIIVVPDGGLEDGSLIEVAEKSMLWLKVEVLGKQVHGSTPEKGVNALYAAARMMVAVREIKDLFPQQNPLFSPAGNTCEPTRKEAGVPNINTIPGRDVFYIDCRILPEVDLDLVEREFITRFKAIAAQEGAKVEISPVQKLRSAPPTPARAPVVAKLQKAIKMVKGVDAEPGGVGGGTVASFFREKGLPVAVWGTFLDTAHIPDEYCKISDLIGDAKIFALLFSGLV